MAGNEQNPGFTPLGYAGQEFDAPRTAQAFQDDRARYVESGNKPMGIRQAVELPAGLSALDVELTHDLGREPSMVLPGIEAFGVVFGSLVLSVQSRDERVATVRVESNLGVPTDVEIIAVILP